jgi:hypothetical protein
MFLEPFSVRLSTSAAYSRNPESMLKDELTVQAFILWRLL